MLNALLLLLLAAGQLELIVTLVNRLHAYRIRGSALRVVRDVHELLIVLLPVLLAWLVGWHGAKLLAGGSWLQLPVGWKIYLALCGLGTLGMVYSAIRYACRRAPTAQVSNHTHVVDVANELGFRPIGNGPYRTLARLPRNQVFEVEVSEKVYRLPRLPRVWHGLSILHLTDFHFIGTIDLPFFERLTELAQQARPDLIVFTGDLLDDMRLIDWLPPTLGRLEAPLGRFFILGNHDWYLEPAVIRQRMTDLGWRDVAGTTVVLDENKPPIVLGGSELPWMGRHPDFSPQPGDAFRILLSHTPDNLSWSRKQRLDLMLSGHNHGGQVVLPVVGPMYSPSVHGCQFASGAFDAPPTLLYVSRGISGRHPVRWRCRPELTKLILHSAS
ncbi:MAG TPA: metallophosphoesterase [Pirellulales bacterium]|nr:metallophosphoesterase [Pirellulales bacterium]